MLVQMSFAEFQTSVTRGKFPAGLSPALQALWHDAADDWSKAHACVQDDDSREGAWVHAYLHRKEGDQGNARYWYSRANRPPVDAAVPLAEEWAELARVLIGGN